MAKTSSDICMIGHRGYSARYPENTALAFRKAYEHGSGGVETDVRITLDGAFVCSHSDTAEYADGTSLAVPEHTLAELTAKPLLNTHTEDTVYLCTFREYLEICRDCNMVCFIELKGHFDDDAIRACFTLAEEVYTLSQCILQSFNFDNLIRAHEMFPALQIMLTFGYGETPEDLARCLAYSFHIDADYKALSYYDVERFHKKGLKVGLWTVNTEEALTFSRLLEPDYIESDIC